MLKCNKCNKTYQAGVYCLSCGEKLQRFESSDTVAEAGAKKNPFLAGFLSFLVVGIGQLYLGQTAKGVVLIVLDIVLIPVWIGTLGVGYSIFCIFGVIDAYRQCTLLKEQKKIGDWTFFSQTKK